MDEDSMSELRRPGSAPPLIIKRDNHGLFGYLRPSTSLGKENVRTRKSSEEVVTVDLDVSVSQNEDFETSKKSLTAETSFRKPQSKFAEYKNAEVKSITRNSAGSVSLATSLSHLEHFMQRKGGRDIQSGFRTPFGEDYIAVGGEVSLLPGDVIKKRLLPEGFVARVKAPPPEKVPLSLDMTIERTSQSFKFAYFEIDLTDRPLHSNPSRTLHIQWTILAGDVEIYFSMSDNHAYPEKHLCDWTVDLSATELIIYPNDAIYKKAKNKKVTIAIRGQMGFLEYKLRAETQAFLSKLEMIFQERATTKAQEDKERGDSMNTIYSAIKNSQLRSMRAKSGLITPEKGVRPSKVKDPAPNEVKIDTEDPEELTTEDMNDLDDIPLRADRCHGFKSQPLASFLDVVLGNLQKEAVREDRYRTPETPFALRLDKLYKPVVANTHAVADHHVLAAQPSQRGAIGMGKATKVHEMPLPSARVKHADSMVSSRGLASSRHYAHDQSRDIDKNITSARGQPMGSARGHSLGSARGQAPGSARGQPPESSRNVPESSREPPELSRNRVVLDSSRTDQTEESSIASGRSAKSSARSGASEKSSSSSMLKGVHRDEARLYTSIYKQYKKEYIFTFKGKDEKGKSAMIVQKETGLNIPRFHELLKDMKILGNTSLEKVPSKRDVTLMSREIYRLRQSEKHPSDEETVLTEIEVRTLMEQIGRDYFDKPLYLVGVKPEAVDKKVWERLRDESNPQKRLQKIAAHPDFKRKLLKAFGRWDKDSDGKLSKEEFVLLCAKEIGLQREDSIGLLQKAGVHRRDSVRLNKFVHILFPETDGKEETDERDTAAAKESKLRMHLLAHHLKELTNSISVDELQKERSSISLMQDQMQVSSTKEPEILKQGWLESRDPKSIITNWRKCYCVVERHAGGGILRIFGHEFNAEETGVKSMEALEILYLDGRNPVEVLNCVIQSEEALESPQDSKKPCIFKVFCKRNALALAKQEIHKKKPTRRRRAGNLSSRSESSVMSEDADGSRSARSWTSRSEAMTSNSQIDLGNTNTDSTKPVWNQSEPQDSDSTFVVQFRICGYHSQEKALEWKNAIYAAVNELELQTNRVLQELGSLLKSTAVKKPIFEFSTRPAARPVKYKVDKGAEDEAANKVKELLRGLLSPASIITPAYDGAGNITLQGLEMKEDSGDYGNEGWEGSGKKGKGGKGRAVHRLPTIVEESDAEVVWE